MSALASGNGGTLFFAGEPGIGKSTLARWLTEEARTRSLPVHWGFCWEAGGAPAYWPWTQSLRSLVAEQDIPGPLLAKLGQLLPEASDDGDPLEFGELCRQLQNRLPELFVFGGCCGTDHRHLDAARLAVC